MSLVRSTTEKKDLLSYLETSISAIGVQCIKELCFEHDLERKQGLNYAELLSLKIALYSLEGKAILT